MAFLPLRKHLGLLPQTGGRFADIVRFTEVHRYLVPEIFPHLYNVSANTANLPLELADPGIDLIGHVLHATLFFLPSLICMIQLNRSLEWHL
ncbi:hypothetical protein D3C81_1027770 [compost metagenome]